MRKRDASVHSEVQPVEVQAPEAQSAADRPQLEPGTVYLSGEEANALPPLSSRKMPTEEECQAALAAYPEVHPGWKYFFARTRELADELRRKEAAKVATEDQETQRNP